MDLILLTVDYLHKEIPIIEAEIMSIESQLRNTVSQDEFNKIKTNIDKTMMEFQTQLQERKRLKFIRDSDDYQRGRPIVASTGSLLSPLAMVLEKILSPLLCHIPSYLRDTSHFLSAIRDVGIVPAECYLVTLDVNSLYTNINNTDGIKAVKSFLDDTTEFNLDLKEFCIALLTLILTKNFFLFEDDFFIQLNGTAMGSNVAPPYANIFMADFEGKFVYTHVLFQQFCPLWKRYIDDIFLIWNGDLDSLFSFYDSINKSVDRLTFSIQHDRKSISFLDTLVTINDDRSLSTDLFC
ncbi:unnamed protein product [Ranitomeya imitator]|uniref:Reverse transcriptase domain-containing protein n=1 Tax=Ranitomeya imitator TaxID=111125 RepID=A0ABN9KRP2_9NEOB|nr:unnamed protein product [Ranitomeya imitator]